MVVAVDTTLLAHGSVLSLTFLALVTTNCCAMWFSTRAFILMTILSFWIIVEMQIGSFLLKSYYNEELLEKWMLECNSSLAGIKIEEQIPKNCYYRMKWRQPVSEEITENNRKQLNALGLSNYTRYSIHPTNGLPANVDAVILVIVRWNDIESRNFLRNTIGPRNKFKLNYNIQLLFVFGIPSDALPEEVYRIEFENQLYQDMIIPGVEDNYHTVGLKLISAFKWISLATSKHTRMKWIIKIDDDVLVNMDAVKEFLSQLKPTDDGIFCRIYNESLPFRNIGSKWYVSTVEYPYSIYPPYCQGAFYLFSTDVATQLISLFEKEFHRNYLWIEDVFLTGILPILGDIALKDLSEKIGHELPWLNFQTDQLLAIFTSQLYPSEREEYTTRIFHSNSHQAQYYRIKSYLIIVAFIALILIVITIFVKLMSKRTSHFKSRAI